MKFESISENELPSQPGGDRAEFDAAVAALREGPIAIACEHETEVKSIRLRLTKAAGRAGVTVTSWWDMAERKVFAKLAVEQPPARVRAPRKPKVDAA